MPAGKPLYKQTFAGKDGDDVLMRECARRPKYLILFSDGIFDMKETVGDEGVLCTSEGRKTGLWAKTKYCIQ